MTPLHNGHRALVVCLLLLASGVASHTAISDWEIDNSAFVTRVVDGDTFVADAVGWVRLADIDTPEVGEPGAAAATAYLTNLVYRRWVHLDVDDLYGTDRYGRLVAVAYVRHNVTHLLNVNQALVDAGHARVWDFPNEFDRDSWSLYVYNPTGEPSTPDSLHLDQAIAVAILLASLAAEYLALPLIRRLKGPR